MSSRRQAVLLDALARGGRHLHEDRVLDGDLPVADQLAERAEPVVDALGVVEPVDAQQHASRVAELLADLLGALLDGVGAGELVEAGGVDRDRVGPGLDDPAVGQVDQVAVRLVADPLADETDEVLGGARALEAHHVGAEQALEELPAPRQLRRTARPAGTGCAGRSRCAGRGAARGASPAPAASGSRAPTRVASGSGDLGGLLREPPVDPHVGVPPLAVELRLGHHVVVERPQRGVGEALVELLDLRRRSAGPG